MKNKLLWSLLIVLALVVGLWGGQYIAKVGNCVAATSVAKSEPAKTEPAKKYTVPLAELPIETEFVTVKHKNILYHVCLLRVSDQPNVGYIQTGWEYANLPAQPKTTTKPANQPKTDTKLDKMEQELKNELPKNSQPKTDKPADPPKDIKAILPNVDLPRPDKLNTQPIG